MGKDKNIDALEKLSDILSFYPACIGYIPLPDEVRYESCAAFRKTCAYTPPTDFSSDPYKEAMEAVARIEERPVCVFVPGQKFDVTGTRYGRGGGWYDRFLSHVPAVWLRIGVCFHHQFSSLTRLERKTWDEPMDVLCVYDGDTPSLVFETYARKVWYCPPGDMSMKHRVSVIAALGARTRALGKDGSLLFDIKPDMKRFAALTSGHPVIMGRKTWESLPQAFRPLPNRTNIVVTRNPSYGAEGALVCRSLDEAVEKAKTSPGSEEVFVIGGGELYELAVREYADRLYLTLVDDDASGDVFFPDYSRFRNILEEEAHPEHTPRYTYFTLE